MAALDIVIVPLLLAPVVTIVLIVAPAGIPLPDNFCPVFSSKCVSATPVPVAVAVADYEIIPLVPTVSIELIVVLF